jgi:hypothetical protein
MSGNGTKSAVVSDSTNLAMKKLKLRYNLYITAKESDELHLASINTQ